MYIKAKSQTFTIPSPTTISCICSPAGERGRRDHIQVGQQEHVHQAAGLLLPPREAEAEVQLKVEEERTGQPISGVVCTAEGHRGGGQVGTYYFTWQVHILDARR